ncbi:MAG: hypothetical protein A2091_13185 [Desulfuromonadales bacterium GWD2_61_12]|nr:MAG: hypothetical protein A2005_03695 [Desulfuromonadales bacterium GWC2_61_20]OGR35491.1 MAG: hypothetical protein A2091_13185 [Desulfuromonadales bacterium GWD2_61_12]HAD04590.1 gamma-glutamylcyclotransferase [Desulfuromonas sp.]HBT83179.1 gamma-glutamylcyclotransferase [Desulfuromonas sp.]
MTLPADIPPAEILYFAYGSNLLLERLRARTSSATVGGPARLDGYRLNFSLTGDDGSGKCAITPAAGVAAQVWGVVYRLAAVELPLLDAAEGVPRLYRRAAVMVSCRGAVMTAFTYLPMATGLAPPPYTWYWQLVVAGALQQGLPLGYIENLTRQVAVVDPDARRPARLIALQVLQSAQPGLPGGRLPVPE